MSSTVANRHPKAPAPNLNLTSEEKRAYGQLFRQADTDNVGVVTGETAVKFFEKTRLDSRVLGEVGYSPTFPHYGPLPSISILTHTTDMADCG